MKSAILFGSTGLVGNNLLNLLIQNKNYSKIKIFTRKDILNTKYTLLVQAYIHI